LNALYISGALIVECATHDVGITADDMIYLAISIKGERKHAHLPDVINTILNVQNRERPHVPVNIKDIEIAII